MNNSDKLRFVGATAKQSIYDTQLPSQPRIGESAFTIPADPKRKKFGRRLFNWIIGIAYREISRFCKNLHIVK